MKKLSIIVPCYNEELNIQKFFKEACQSLTNVDYNIEYIFINDGSTDNTLIELKKLLTSKKKIKIINFSRNFGKESAIYAGLNNCEGDYAVLIDADLQQHPKLIIDMLTEFKNNEDVDIVAYFQEKRIEKKILGFCKSNFYKIINKITKLNFINGASDFRMINRNVINTILKFTDQNRFQKGIFAYIGFNTKYIPYVAEKRYSGETSWNFKKLFHYAIDGIMSFTEFPLKIPMILGKVELLISIILSLILIILKIFNIIYYFFIFFLFLSSLVLISLGILSKYIYRSYSEARKRPIYIIKEVLLNE